MRRLFPSSYELTIFAVLAISCASIVRLFSAWDLAMAGVAIPLFIACCVMGLRRHGHLTVSEAAIALEENESANRQ